jgi:CO/xanthine dehydrogenase FAD-binding subunit
MNRPLYRQPGSLQALIGYLAEPGGRILAGGTDFYPGLGDMPSQGPVIDISRLDELSGIRISDEWISIGAATSWSDLIAADLPPCFDGLKAAAREVGAIQIQNRATIGGNLCNASPAADGVPPLLTLDAELVIASSGGTRRMPLDRFILGNRKTALKPGEILTAIEVKRSLGPLRSRFLKLGARRYLVISIVMVAVGLRVDADGLIGEARIAIGSCSPVAKRLPALEADLRGKKADAGLSDIVEARHLAPLSPIDDVRATAEYRMLAARELIARAIDACLGV